LAIGRLTKQKNFIFLIENFYKIFDKISNYSLLIIGSGEEKKKLENRIKELNMMSKIKILSYKKNIYNYYRNADLFVLTSLWEDPGFVLLEAAMNNLLVLSSDCPNGPKEFINNEMRGFSYNSNNNEEFRQKLLYVLKNLNTKETLEKKINAKKFCRKFTFFKHYQSFSKVLKIY
jgi:glycosyltransferase involved in cell wall biosynthesis